MSLSKVLFVEGGPSNSIISFTLELLSINLSCFLSKKCTPWCFITLFNVQFEINKKIVGESWLESSSWSINGNEFKQELNEIKERVANTETFIHLQDLKETDIFKATAQVEKMCEKLLANTVIENYLVEIL